MFKKPKYSAFMLFLLLSFILVSIGMEVLEIVLISAGVATAVFSSLWYLIFLQVLRVIAPLLLWLKLTKSKFAKHMPNQPLDLTNIGMIIVLSIILQPTVMLISSIFSMFVPNTAANVMAQLSNHPWWLMMLTIAVTPAIVEEVAFRGYMQSVQKGPSFIKIALMNGFLFGVMHLSPHQFLYTFVLGVVFAYMVHYTKSIWSAILSHFVINGSQLTLFFWASAQEVDPAMQDQTFAQALYESVAGVDPELGQRIYNWAAGMTVEQGAALVMAVLAVFTTPIAAAVFYGFIDHNRRRNAKLAADAVVVEEEASAEDEEVQKPAGIFARIDWYLVAVIAIFLLMVLPQVFIL